MRHPDARFARLISFLWLLPGVARAAPDFVAERVVVVGRVADGPWTDAATEARADQPVELAAIVVGHRGKQRAIRAPDGVDKVTLAGRATATEPLGSAAISWAIVEPHGFRTGRAPNGATSEFYANVSTEPHHFGKWLGYDRIDYFERALPAMTTRLPVAIRASEAPSDGLGTLFYKATVDGLASPGAEATDTYGLARTVHRVSIRRGDDFLGQLTGYLLVPEVFGSAGPGRDHQTERFTGADCADVMVGAARRMGKRLEYTNVEGLTAYARTIVKSTDLDDHGAPARPIAGVQPGDLIRIDYGGALRGATPRSWDHVAALWEDRSDPAGPAHGGPDGKLDGFDLVIHMGHPRLVIEPLANQAPATIDVLRWRDQK